MIALTFAEQVKIILGRKNMTIKQLAECIEEQTNMKMSRQNLTQRLGRDNFQEKDMRMIAQILDCQFQLSIIDMEADTEEQAKENEKSIEMAEALCNEDADAEILAPEEQAAEKIEEYVAETMEEHLVETIEEQIFEEIVEPTEEYIEDTADDKLEEQVSQVAEPVVEKVNPPAIEIVEPEKSVYERELTIGEMNGDPEILEEVNIGKGDINPYTGYEHKNNSVRIHPKRLGYVQVYDRTQHKWTEMTEWAFLGYQERQRLNLGKAYEEPTYLD